MKKQKKALAELKVTSFTTKANDVKGGSIELVTGHCCSGTHQDTVCW